MVRQQQHRQIAVLAQHHGTGQTLGVRPAGCHRTIYVCDDGKEKAKRRMCERMGRDVQYVSGRDRQSGEMNGKSGNLNNACRQIYPAGCKIPDNEVICVMDADQVGWGCSSGFSDLERHKADMLAGPCAMHCNALCP